MTGTGRDLPPADRREAIARVAERLFAQRGYDGVSIRDIATQAKVNSALVGYYFGTKEQLYRTFFDRRYHDITERRREALGQLSIRPNALRSLRAIVRAWGQPLLDMMEDPACRDFVSLLAREASDSSADPRGIFRDFLDPGAQECIDALHRALPDARTVDIVHGYLWMVASMSSYITTGARAKRIGASAAYSREEFMQGLEVFVGQGLLSLGHAARPASRPRGA